MAGSRTIGGRSSTGPGLANSTGDVQSGRALNAQGEFSGLRESTFELLQRDPVLYLKRNAEERGKSSSPWNRGFELFHQRT